MRILSSLPVLLTLFLAQTMAAQEPAIAPSPQPAGPQKTAREYYVEDGGAHGGILESIEVPPTLKAPFTLLLETEWVRGLPDGGLITTVNKRRIARDADGRIYEERWFLVPKDGKVPSQMTTIQISDPHNHALYNCFMLREISSASWSPIRRSLVRFSGFKGRPPGRFPTARARPSTKTLANNWSPASKQSGRETPSSTTRVYSAMTEKCPSSANSGSRQNWDLICFPGAPTRASAPKPSPRPT